ncbi:AraC family transcriptional regulator [Paenibacillus sp. FSL H8-0537]|uniref:helix-turn-helix transcriptional regulator n=1 Tax=Paenibacillus sp. FSL H8-0537 TaxID=2921399 RepID=UPI003100D0FF
MKHTLEAQHIESLYNEWIGAELGVPVEQLADTVKLPEHWGDGYLQRTRLRPGMELHTIDVKLHENHIFHIDVQYPHLEISLTQHGNGCWSIEGRRGERAMGSGGTQMIYLHDTRIHFEQLHSDRLAHMELRIDFSIWKHLFSYFPWQAGDTFYCEQQQLTPEIKQVFDQLKNCPYTGPIRQHYLEGKAFELIALFWYGLEQKSELESAASRLKTADVERLHQAKNILYHNRTNPPGLLELARQTGLNDFKLKAGFKELFGTTVFGYIREERMREAKQLLEQGRMNVSEAAIMVGYTNMSHFASLFRKTFGINPSEYARQQSRSM